MKESDWGYTVKEKILDLSKVGMLGTSSTKRTINRLPRALWSSFQQSKHCHGASNKLKKRYQSVHIRTEVISGLVKQYQIRAKLDETREKKQMFLSEEKKEWLLTSFYRSDITYNISGRKDNMYIRKENRI